MSKAFQGTINVDIRDSVPDWAPFAAPKAPDGAPNVVYIVLDDVGFSALNCHGGPSRRRTSTGSRPPAGRSSGSWSTSAARPIST